ncbi:MAG TPA: hypothetical protein VHI98_09755 [Vicinamibacterales bacterium]|jgi:hypothetical protein|nr:hypothetical protein [Vicinamibacterales bacterium]
MDKYDEDYEQGRLPDTVCEARSIAALVIAMALVFTAYFAMRVAMPDLLLHVQHALAALPS